MKSDTLVVGLESLYVIVACQASKSWEQLAEHARVMGNGQGRLLLVNQVRNKVFAIMLYLPLIDSPTSPPSPSPGCGDPGVPANGKKIGESYKVGSIVYYECNTGFRLEGPKSRLCRFDGKWTDSLPSCVGNGRELCNDIVQHHIL